MDNKKLTELEELTTPASGDKLLIIDASEEADEDKPKQIDFANFKGETGETGAVGPQGEQGEQGEQGVPGLNWLGAYVAETTYAVDDAVSYLGSSYICILGSTGNLPTNATYWELLASKGTEATSGCAFRVSRNAAANTGNNAFATVEFDTEQYDLGADVASGVFTAPADGYYTFSWNVGMTCDATARAIIAALFINGTEYSRGTQLVAVASGISSSGGTDTVYMTAGQTADIRAYGTVALALRVGTTSYTFFSGRLVIS